MKKSKKMNIKISSNFYCFELVCFSIRTFAIGNCI